MNISQVLIAHTGIILMSLENLIPSACTMPDLWHKLSVHPPIYLSSSAPTQSNPERPPPNNMHLSSPQGRRNAIKKQMCLSHTFWGICSTIRGQPWLGRAHVLWLNHYQMPGLQEGNRTYSWFFGFLILPWVSSWTRRSRISFLLQMYDSDENTARHIAIQFYTGRTVEFENVC